ncbi:MAG TPA: serine/threonine-protein kinase [Vicinamibacterales bacterium]|nr:serine/threonine-protein kinase [Vicinamibacterales bacterium]
MGEVYRARDTKLNRDVALKVLPEALAADPDRLARFQREAQVLAALNHPNIAHIHGFEDAGAVHAIVMELVEGPTLAEIIAGRQQDESVSPRPRDGASAAGRESLQPVAPGAGPRRRDGSRALRGLKIDDALAIARQIADALEAAHEQGIVHRDLKPANVKVREDGTVKVLDFGLAKALVPEGAGATADAMNSPTLTARATQMGMILGTAAYMAPEQARGKAVDRRADIWAFGAMLYEMVTGARVRRRGRDRDAGVGREGPPRPRRRARRGAAPAGRVPPEEPQGSAARHRRRVAAARVRAGRRARTGRRGAALEAAVAGDGSGAGCGGRPGRAPFRGDRSAGRRGPFRGGVPGGHRLHHDGAVTRRASPGGRRGGPDLGAIVRRPRGPADRTDRGRHLPVLVARQRLDRLLRRRTVEDGRACRRTGAVAGAGTGGPRGSVEPRRHDPVQSRLGRARVVCRSRHRGRRRGGDGHRVRRLRRPSLSAVPARRPPLRLPVSGPVRRRAGRVCGIARRRIAGPRARRRRSGGLRRTDSRVGRAPAVSSRRRPDGSTIRPGIAHARRRAVLGGRGSGPGAQHGLWRLLGVGQRPARLRSGGVAVDRGELVRPVGSTIGGGQRHERRAVVHRVA